MKKKVIWIIVLFCLFLSLVACYKLSSFVDKVINETKKTVNFTLDLDEKTPETIESLIEKGEIDQVIFKGRVYKLQEPIERNNIGTQIGFIGQTYYVDQYGELWSKEELKKPYVYGNPKEIREKKPMRYGAVYSIKEKNVLDRDELILELNKKYYKIALI